MRTRARIASVVGERRNRGKDADGVQSRSISTWRSGDCAGVGNRKGAPNTVRAHGEEMFADSGL